MYNFRLSDQEVPYLFSSYLMNLQCHYPQARLQLKEKACSGDSHLYELVDVFNIASVSFYHVCSVRMARSRPPIYWFGCRISRARQAAVVYEGITTG